MIIIKIGGGANINLEGIVKDLSNLDEKYIIVHGANALRDSLAEKLGYEKRIVNSVSGFSSVYSDEEALDIMMMAYAGLRNKRLVELCRINGINAVGLSGLDGGLISGARNKGIRVKEGGKLKILRDFSGKPKSVNFNLLNLLLENDFVPLLTVPISDERGCAVNSENDDIIALIQGSLKADKIIQLIEAKGYLENKEDENSLIRNLNSADLELIEARVEGRMKRKIYALKKLFESGKTRVHISDGRVENPIKDALNGAGTIIE